MLSTGLDGAQSENNDPVREIVSVVVVSGVSLKDTFQHQKPLFQ